MRSRTRRVYESNSPKNKTRLEHRDIDPYII